MYVHNNSNRSSTKRILYYLPFVIITHHNLIHPIRHPVLFHFSSLLHHYINSATHNIEDKRGRERANSL